MRHANTKLSEKIAQGRGLGGGSFFSQGERPPFVCFPFKIKILPGDDTPAAAAAAAGAASILSDPPLLLLLHLPALLSLHLASRKLVPPSIMRIQDRNINTSTCLR